MTIENIYCYLADDLRNQMMKGMEWWNIGTSLPIDDCGHGIVVWCDEDRDGRYFDITIRKNYTTDDWGENLGITFEACTGSDSFDELKEYVTQMLRDFYNRNGFNVLTSRNIYRIDFEEKFCGVIIPRSVIFNITQISEKEVNELINRGLWEDDDRIVELRPKQFKYLQDKEG